MVHYTNNMRSKRVDVRPNASQRRIMGKRVENSKTVQDVRVTRVQKGDRKQRNFAPAEVPAGATSNKTNDEKYVMALKKKMKDIDRLMERKKNGEKLNTAQLDKIDRLPELLAEIESFMPVPDQEER
jgi:uncharacterized protein with WD repeat